MLRRVGSFVAMILVATFVLAACGSPSEEVKPTVTRTDAENAPPPPTATTEGGAAVTEAAAEPTKAASGGGTVAGPVTIDVVMVDIAFETKEYTVPANTEVTVNIVNNGAATHNFNIDALKVSSGDMAAGEKKTLTFNSGAAGEYEFYCNIPGHKEAGMVGKLIVTEEAAAPPAETTEAAGSGGAPAAQTTFDVEMKDIAFSVKEITVPANTEITINLVNNGAATHNFDITDLDVASGDYASGQTGTVTFNSGPAGEHEFFCNIPGHKEAGMVGKLIVVEGGGAETPAEVTPAAETTEAAAAPDAPAAQTTFDVELKDIAFSVKELTVPANTEITVNVVNTGAATHNFEIPDLAVKTGDMASGQKTTVTFNSGAAGEHEFLCTIPGHKEAGMVGKLIVVEGGGAAAAEPTAATSTEATAAASPSAVAPVTTLDIELLDIKFSETAFTVPANTEITVNLTNNGAATHNFNIDALKVASGDIAAGETKTLTFNSGAAGEYEFYCNIPGHKEVGMVGKLTVVDAAGAETAPAEAAGATTLDVEMKDIAFGTKELTVPANSEITINLVNNGAASHNFNIDDLSVASGDYAGGQTGTVTFKTGAPGEYEYYCNIPGHKEAGMVGKLIVK